LTAALAELEEKHGEITLFALFLRDHPLKRWDLIVAAPWLRYGDLDLLKTVCDIVQAQISYKEISKLSRVVILNHDDPTVVYLRENYDVPSGNPAETID